MSGPNDDSRPVMDHPSATREDFAHPRVVLDLLTTLGVRGAPMAGRKMAVATWRAANEPLGSLMVSLDDTGLRDQAAASGSSAVGLWGPIRAGGSRCPAGTVPRR